MPIRCSFIISPSATPRRLIPRRMATRAQGPGVGLDGALIGGGLRLRWDHRSPSPPRLPRLAWQRPGDTFRLDQARPPCSRKRVLFSRREGDHAFVIGIDNGVPYRRDHRCGRHPPDPVGAPLAAGSWHHLAVVAESAQSHASRRWRGLRELHRRLPALASPLLIGGDRWKGHRLQAASSTSW